MPRNGQARWTLEEIVEMERITYDSHYLINGNNRWSREKLEFILPLDGNGCDATSFGPPSPGP